MWYLLHNATPHTFTCCCVGSTSGRLFVRGRVGLLASPILAVEALDCWRKILWRYYYIKRKQFSVCLINFSQYLGTRKQKKHRVTKIRSKRKKGSSFDNRGHIFQSRLPTAYWSNLNSIKTKKQMIKQRAELNTESSSSSFTTIVSYPSKSSWWAVKEKLVLKEKFNHNQRPKITFGTWFLGQGYSLFLIETDMIDVQ